MLSSTIGSACCLIMAKASSSLLLNIGESLSQALPAQGPAAPAHGSVPNGGLKAQPVGPTIAPLRTAVAGKVNSVRCASILRPDLWHDT